MAGLNSNRFGKAELRFDLMELINERDPSSFDPMADKILPPVIVRQTSGNIPVKDNGDGSRLMNIKRGEKGAYARGRNIFTSATYLTTVFGYEEPIDNMEDIEADELMDLEELNTEIVDETLEVHKEKRVADLLFNTGTFSGSNDSQTATAVWTLSTAKIRQDDIWPAANKLKKKSRVKRKQLSFIATIDTIDNIMLTDDVREAVKFSGVRSVDEISRVAQLDYLAQFWQIKEVIQVDNQFNTKGFDIDAEFTDLWNDSFALLAFLSPATSGSNWGAGLGRQPFFAKATQGQTKVIESYDETTTDQFIIRAKHRMGENAFSKYGVLFKVIK